MKWDIPLLDGYRWLALPNYSLSRHAGSFFTYVNPQIWRSIHSDDFDAVVLHTGYVCATFWIAMLAAKWSRLAVLLSTDAHSLSARDHKKWKVWIKKLLWPCLFGLADVVIVPSSGGVTLMNSLGIPESRVLTPYPVDNEWSTEQSMRVDRAGVLVGRFLKRP